MRILTWLLAALPLTLSAQSSGTCATPFMAASSPNGELTLTLRAGDTVITGTDASAVRVTCTVGDQRSAGDIKISFAANHLTLRGGPDNDVSFHIEVPRSVSLRIRESAGNLTIGNVIGDKDVTLNAGNMTIEVGDAASYRNVNASVLVGNLSALPFGGEKDGMFRSFQHENPGGKYRLHASLLAGNLTLK
jgi:hypothetical protein